MEGANQMSTKKPKEFTSAESYLGKEVEVKIDRAIGSQHPKHSHMIYTVNYGFVPGTLSPDGEELDAYVLAVDKPVEVFRGTCIGFIRRSNDNDDKLLIVPEGVTLTYRQIKEMVSFQEKFFKSTIIRITTKKILNTLY
jgi:inorganic pyrophosphatase